MSAPRLLLCLSQAARATLVGSSRQSFTVPVLHAASAWRFEGADHDATRVHQSWGRPEVRTVFRTASDYLWVDETDPLSNLQTRTHQVVAGTVFWGNNGMLAQIYTVSGGAPCNVDTVENVWASRPRRRPGRGPPS